MRAKIDKNWKQYNYLILPIVLTDAFPLMLSEGINRVDDFSTVEALINLYRGVNVYRKS
mgnify:CR=1 FL=1